MEMEDGDAAPADEMAAAAPAHASGDGEASPPQASHHSPPPASLSPLGNSLRGHIAIDTY